MHPHSFCTMVEQDLAAPAFAQTASPAKPGGQPLQDPTTKYPEPPFKKQSQPWPSLASKVEPRPNHGETSYRGAGRLAGRKALITGSDSGMGRAAAIAYPAKAPASRSTVCRRRSRQQCRPAAKPPLDPRHLDGAVRLDDEDEHLCTVLDLKAALPHLPPGAAIIGTASEQAYDPSPNLYDYAQRRRS
jgi:hypothetical protein